MFPFEVKIDDKIRQWGEQDAESLRRLYPHATIDTEQVIRCKAICKAAAAHYTDKSGQSYVFSLSVSDLYGKTDEEILALIERKVAAKKRSAGARVLSKKYGQEGAERIIRRKAGKTIHLQD